VKKSGFWLNVCPCVGTCLRMVNVNSHNIYPIALKFSRNSLFDKDRQRVVETNRNSRPLKGVEFYLSVMNDYCCRKEVIWMQS